MKLKNRRHYAGDGQGNIASELIHFSLPLICSGVLQQLYNWVDAFIVGHVEGDLALGAIGAVGSVIDIFVLSLTGFTSGLAILFARSYGAGSVQAIRQLLAGFSVGLGAVYLVLAAAGFFLVGPLLQLMDAAAETVKLSEGYLKIILAGVPFLAVYNVYSAALRGLGDSRTPFLSIMFSSCVNFALDVLFVAWLRWSVYGAALATVISQASMTVFIIFIAPRLHSQLSLCGEKITLPLLRDGLRLGLPPMVQSSISAVGNVLLQRFLNSFGVQMVTAITTAYRVDTILMLPIINLGSAVSTLTAQSCGAGRPWRGRRIMAAGIKMMFGMAAVLSCFIILVGGKMMAMFGVSDYVAGLGHMFFKEIAVFYVVFGMAMAVRGYIEGMGDVLFSSIAGIAALASRLAASYGMLPLWGNAVIAYAEAFSWGVLLMMYLLRMFFCRGRLLPHKQ